MEVKIDTKEKFTVITPNGIVLSDNLTAELSQIAAGCLQNEIKNVVLNLQQVQSINESSAEKLAMLQEKFYENSASFVICEVQKTMEDELEKYQLLETMNITPTESEAWDIVQMEEIERELMDDDNPLFNDHGDKE